MATQVLPSDVNKGLFSAFIFDVDDMSEGTKDGIVVMNDNWDPDGLINDSKFTSSGFRGRLSELLN